MCAYDKATDCATDEAEDFFSQQYAKLTKNYLNDNSFAVFTSSGTVTQTAAGIEMKNGAAIAKTFNPDATGRRLGEVKKPGKVSTQFWVQPSKSDKVETIGGCLESTKSQGYKKDGTTMTRGVCAQVGTDGSFKIEAYKEGTVSVFPGNKKFTIDATAQVGAKFAYYNGTLQLRAYAKTSGDFKFLGVIDATWKASVSIDVAKMISSPEAFFTLSWLKVDFSFCILGWCSRAARNLLPSVWSIMFVAASMLVSTLMKL